MFGDYAMADTQAKTGAFGLGLRARLGYFTVLRLDFAKLTDFDRIFPETKVQFFFGWNY